MPQFLKSLTGSFIGKVLGALFIAICFALGVGPDKWAIFMIQNLPIWLTPFVAQMSFIALAAVTFLTVFRPWNWLKRRTPVPVVTETSHKKIPFGDAYPDLRLADSEAALELFKGIERRKLIALLQGGHIKAWARLMAKGQTPLGEDTDLLAIAPDIWSKHALQHMPKLREGMIAQTFLKTNGHGHSIYYDVWLNSAQIAEGFPLIIARLSSAAPERRRIPIKEFIEIAGKSGWNLDTNEILDLERGVQQDALFGDLKLWGRRNFQRLPILNVHEPLQEIPKDHWKDFRPQLLDAMDADKNIHARSWSREFGQGADHLTFLDLHIDGGTSIPWLTGNGLQYKGWTKRQEQERDASRRAK